MRVVSPIVLSALLIASLLAVSPVQAQEDSTTWNMSNFTEPTGSGSFLTLDAPSGNGATATCTGCAGGNPYATSSAEPTPASELGYISTGATGTAHVVYKSWNNLPAPSTKVTVTVKADGSAIATGTLTKDVMNGGIVAFDVPLSYTGGDLPAGAKLSWTVTAADGTTGMYNPAAYPRSDGSNAWSFTLPIVPLAPAPEVTGPVQHTLDLNMSSWEMAFSNATSDEYTLNFTTNLTVAHAAFTVNGTGLANATIVDGNGTEVYNGTVENGTVDFGNVTAGQWQLNLDFTDFNGTFAFALLSPEAAEEQGTGTGTGQTGETGSGEGEGDGTGNETVDDAHGDKESPGVALPLLSIGLIAAAFAMRRRD